VVSNGEALELLQGWWNRFFLLTGESVERLPPLDTTDIEKAYQKLCESLVTPNREGYDASRMASNRDLSWHPISSTSTPLICQTPYPQVCIHRRSSNHACWWGLASSGKSDRAVESKGMAVVSKYPQTWKLKLRTTKAVLAVFNLFKKWLENTTRLRTFIHDIGTPLLEWPRQEQRGSGRLRTGVGRLRSCLHKWGIAPSAACECGEVEQTVDHVVLHCPIHWSPCGAHGQTFLDDETIEWQLNTCPEI